MIVVNDFWVLFIGVEIWEMVRFLHLFSIFFLSLVSGFCSNSVFFLVLMTGPFVGFRMFNLPH